VGSEKNQVGQPRNHEVTRIGCSSVCMYKRCWHRAGISQGEAVSEREGGSSRRVESTEAARAAEGRLTLSACCLLSSAWSMARCMGSTFLFESAKIPLSTLKSPGLLLVMPVTRRLVLSTSRLVMAERPRAE
jgi:hypothetical protein